MRRKYRTSARITFDQQRYRVSYCIDQYEGRSIPTHVCFEVFCTFYTNLLTSPDFSDRIIIYFDCMRLLVSASTSPVCNATSHTSRGHGSSKYLANRMIRLHYLKIAARLFCRGGFKYDDSSVLLTNQ